MRSRLAKILGAGMLVALALVWNSCGTQPGCPTCGTTTSGAYGVIDIIPVPEHNPTGEPGGPFNSFDISWFDPNRRLVYTSDRIGLDVVATDTVLDQALYTIGGSNEVAEAGNNNSPCVATIPSVVTGAGAIRLGGTASPQGAAPTKPNELTRFGCRNPGFFESFKTFFPPFGANGNFGGFPGAQCCASRANGVNPISGPDGLLVTPDGNTLVAGSGSATLVVFNLRGAGPAMAPPVVGAFPTGASADFDGPAGVGPCIASWNGGAGSDPTCADDRSDEMAFGTVMGHDILAVANGDPSNPIVTFADITDLTHGTTAAPFVVPAGMGNCLPKTPAANYNPGVADIPNLVKNGVYAFLAGSTPANYPTCILGQIYYDGTGAESSGVQVDNGVAAPGGGISAACPDPSTSVASGVSGTGVGIAGNAVGGTGAGSVNVPCHHAPIVDINTGFFITSNGTAGANQAGEVAVAGTGALAFNRFGNNGAGTFYVENLNCTASNLATQSSVAVGCIDEVDPRIGNINGPIVINVIPVLNCMPAGIVQGPGHDFLVGCGGHDGTQFPPLMIIFDGTCTSSAACVKTFTTITQTGGTDEIWFNPGDNKYYTAGRDMPNGPVMGVIDAGRRQWLVNVPTGSNSHSIAADSFNNHILVPLQAGARCTTQSSNGCIGVYAQQ